MHSDLQSTQRSPWFKWGVPILIIVAAYVLVQVMIVSKAKPAKKPPKNNVTLVEVAEVQLQPLRLSISSRGTVKPRQQINLISEVAGSVLWVSPLLHNGGQVKKGDVLLKVDPINYQVAVAEAAAALAQTELSLADEKAEYQRGKDYGIKNQVEMGVLRSRKLAAVEAEYLASKERLRKAKQQLDKTEFLAPFDAIIKNKAVDLGQYVAVGNNLLMLLGSELAEIQLPVMQSELEFLPYPLPVPVVLTQTVAGKTLQWQAELVRVENLVDEQTRVVNTIAEFKAPYANTNQPLSLGMFVQATLQAKQIDQAVRIPLSALHGDKVYVVVGEQLFARAVHVYRKEQQHAIIDQGLANGDLLVMTKLDLMIEGMTVSTRLNQALLAAITVTTTATTTAPTAGKL